MASQLWLICAALAVPLIFYLTSLTRRRGRLPPGPTPLPLIGNLLSLRGNLHHTLARLAGVHGPVMSLKLGLTTAVVVSTRAAAAEAFTKHDRRLAARPVPDATRVLGVPDRSMIWLPSSDPLWKTLHARRRSCRSCWRHMLHAFDWRLPDGVSPDDLDLTEKFTTSNIMSVPLRAVPVDRRHNRNRDC